jgi:hypothetical protein
VAKQFVFKSTAAFGPGLAVVQVEYAAALQVFDEGCLLVEGLTSVQLSELVTAHSTGDDAAASWIRDNCNNIGKSRAASSEDLLFEGGWQVDTEHPLNDEDTVKVFIKVAEGGFSGGAVATGDDSDGWTVSVLPDTGDIDDVFELALLEDGASPAAGVEILDLRIEDTLAPFNLDDVPEADMESVTVTDDGNKA